MVFSYGTFLGLPVKVFALAGMFMGFLMLIFIFILIYYDASTVDADIFPYIRVIEYKRVSLFPWMT